MIDNGFSVSGHEGTVHARSTDELLILVDEVVMAEPVLDLHTHLFPTQFRELNLWGIDELLNYHYLIAELFRFSPIEPADFWRMGKTEQADLIWRTLFVENTPLSEATRGVIKVLSALGLDPRASDLQQARQFFSGLSPDGYVDRVFEIAGVSSVVMTNDPLDENEIPFWYSDEKLDSRFLPALRLDRLLNDWADAAPRIGKQGYQVNSLLDNGDKQETRRFLDDWIATMHPLYLGVSLPDDFMYPQESPRGELLRDVVLPTCREHDISLALMIGVRRKVNPELNLAGDGIGQADLRSISNICAENPDVRFLVTALSRENQHELCVLARKFRNLMPFGCWWFLNNPSIISEITRERLELLGTSFIPQHSDARILDQLIYKWDHSRRVVADALFESYNALARDGRLAEPADVRRDVRKLFSLNFSQWVGLASRL